MIPTNKSRVAATPPPPTPFAVRRQQAARLYGSGDGRDRVLASYYDRRVAEFAARGDRENVRLSRAEQERLRELARKAEVPESVLATLLTVQRERDQFPLGEEAKATRREQTREALRLKLGDSAVREQVLQDYVRATAVIAKELPEFAVRMDATGASLDPRNVEALAPLGARLRELEQQAKK